MVHGGGEWGWTGLAGISNLEELHDSVVGMEHDSEVEAGHEFTSGGMACPTRPGLPRS